MAGLSSALALGPVEKVVRHAGELATTQNQRMVAEIVKENQQSREEAVNYGLVLVCIHGGWGGWSEFSSCSQTRWRTCDNPKPE